VTIPSLRRDGTLPPGEHQATATDVRTRYGTNSTRMQLLDGLDRMLAALKAAGCSTVFLDGSFVTSKDVPGDFDLCYDETGINWSRLDPVPLDFNNGRAAHKAKFGGEAFPGGLAGRRHGHDIPRFLPAAGRRPQGHHPRRPLGSMSHDDHE
jgi:hypothetical protein